MSSKDQVLVTAALLSLIIILHSARRQFINESSLAEELGLEKPDDYWKRCDDLFFKRFSREVQLIGLAANQQTFEALMRMEVSEELMRTPSDQLPKKFAFDPWLGMGYGGIKRLKASLWKVVLKMESGILHTWWGDADDREHAEGQAIADANARTGEQVLDIVSLATPLA